MPFAMKSKLLTPLWAALCLSSCSSTQPVLRVEPSAAAVEQRTIRTEVRQGYSILIETISQPVDHGNPFGSSFEQQVIILRPDDASADAPVLFMLGNETDSTPARLEAQYRNYGSPKDVVFITADHRGYGQSIPDQDQSRPTYVTVRQTLADYDRLVRHYKIRFGGEWIGCGCSYGGGLVINFAHDYPDAFAGIIASSALTRFEFLMPEYAAQASINLGPELTRRMRFHMEALQPGQLYDEKWVDRERLLALISGLSQIEELQPLKPVVVQLAMLPTPEFLARLKRDLPADLLRRIDDWAVRRAPTGRLPPDEVRKGNYNWYTWKYQQCTETGTFFTGGLFTHQRVDHIADCRATFGEEPPYANAKPWPVSEMLGNLTMPAVIVSGGRDPWIHVGVKPGHQYSNVDYVYFADALHCPDIYDAAAGRTVFEKARKMIQAGLRR